MAAGKPAIRHVKGKRDVNKDIEFEERGDHMNNFLWNNIGKLTLEGDDYSTCALEVADWLKTNSESSDLKFLNKVGDAMHEWQDLLDKPM